MAGKLPLIGLDGTGGVRVVVFRLFVHLEYLNAGTVMGSHSFPSITSAKPTGSAMKDGSHAMPIKPRPKKS